MNKTNTRRAFFLSLVSLLLCFTMMLGTTFAWFTDNVTIENNRIVAGNLDVEMYYKNGEMTTYADVEGFTGESFFVDEKGNDILWEPGVVSYTNFKVVNEGNLALKYTLKTIADEFNTVNGGANSLKDVIKVGVINSEKTFANRADAVAAVTSWQSFEAFSKEDAVLLPETGKNEEAFTVVLYWAPNADDVDNIYNLNNDKKADDNTDELYINVDITLVATQYTHEEDSFDNTYDEDAIVGDIWDGSADSEGLENNTDTAAKTVTITSAEELFAFAEAVNAGNTYAGYTVTLADNIDLAGKAWTPVGLNADSNAKFKGVFDGNDKTIYNLYVNTPDGYTAAGLFGALNGTVKNLNVVNAEINHISTGSATDNGIAVVAGSIYTKGAIDNVHVKNATVNGNRYIGGISGYTYGSVTNSSVTNVTLTALPNDMGGSYDNGDKVGGIAGYFASESVYKISGNTANNVAIKAYRDAGGIVGAGNTGNYVVNNTSNNVTIIIDQTTNSYGSKAANAGAIVGRVLSGEVDDSNVANGFVSYEGAEVAEGVLQSGRNLTVLSAEGLVNLEGVITSIGTGEGRGVTVELMADVDLSGVEWNPIDNMWVTFDGNGHTISNMTTAAIWRAGFFGYAGAVTIENLTFENANVTGSQAGILAGSGEALKSNNIVIKGENTVTFTETSETWNGIGAVTGVLTNSTINATIDADATVVVNKGDMTTDTGCVYVDNLTGYISANNGTITNNGTVTLSASATDDASLDTAIAGGADTVYLGSGNFIIPDSATNKTLTIIGNGDTVIDAQDDGAAEGDCDYSFSGSNVTFENVTITTATTYFPGYARMKGIYNNCTINGVWTLYDNSEFNNCTFNVSGDVYNVWTWGATTATFNNCTFNNDGKAILLYGGVNTKLTVNGCTFNDNGDDTVTGKAAIEIGNDYNKSYELIVDDATVNGYAINTNGINTGSTLWANKNSMPTDKLNVVVDGVDVY